MKCGIITLTQSTIYTDNFDLLSDADSYVIPFETGITRSELVSGYTSYDIPDTATVIRAQSNAGCTNYVDAVIQVTPTPTPTISITPTRTPSVTPTRTPTRTPSVTPTRTSSVTPTPTNSPPIPTPSATSTYTFSYEGIWLFPDPVHPNGGTVQYYDYGGLQTINNIYSNDGCQTVQVLSVDFTVGVIPDCL